MFNPAKKLFRIAMITWLYVGTFVAKSLWMILRYTVKFLTSKKIVKFM